MPKTPEERITELETQVEKLTGLLLGIQNDPRFQAKIRKQIFAGEHTANKPSVVNEKGKKYNLQTV